MVFHEIKLFCCKKSSLRVFGKSENLNVKKSENLKIKRLISMYLTLSSHEVGIE
jgi:hypothetical protein